ncbi:MAG: hypothetical protein WEC16_00440 [Anaerolineales bacterium]
MTLPSLVLGAIVATLLGAAFHLWRGGGLGRFLLYLFLAWLGFWVGHFLASQFDVAFFSIGPLYLGVGVLASLGLLFLGHWLLVVQPKY